MPRPYLEPNRRILIVDGNHSIHQDFREILCPGLPASAGVDDLEQALFGESAAPKEQTGFELDSAYQGQEALAMVHESLAEKCPYALAFVDVRMPPGWDGIETIAQIWKAYPALQVVICTAYSDYSWDEMRAKVGQPDNLVILKKPFDNIEVQQLAHALTKKWWLNLQSELHVEEMAKTNASLAISEERFSKAFRESPIPSAIQSLPDQRFVDVNDRLLHVAGFERHEVIGQTAASLLLWENPGLADEWYAALQRQEAIRDQSAILYARGGGRRDMLVSLSQVVLNGQSHALLLAQDISERALLERQLRQAQKMEAIGQLAAGVAHDFNNILTVIQGHAGLLKQRHPGTDPDAKSIDQITHASHRAATLVRQLLMFSRKQVMQFGNLDLNNVLRNTLEMLRRLVGEHVELEYKPQDRLPAMSADCTMLEQVVMNLAVNARDAMPNGGRVTIATSSESIQRGPTALDPESRNGEFVALTFSDTGSGMDTQVLSRIFEPFFTTKPPGKGTGLGLSTVFGIVRQHKGWLEVESDVNQGTTFRVYFPASGEVAEKVAAPVNTTLRHGKETVLVAEDEEALRQMIVHVLRNQGYTVLEAGSGPEALELWKQTDRPVDLLVTDMVMPGGIMGRELAQRLAQQLPSLRVIYTSGYSPGMAGTDLSLLAERNFLPKPFSIDRLAQLVRESLDAPAKQN